MIIYQRNIENRILIKLEEENGSWNISKYYDKNAFFIVEKNNNYSSIINIGFCMLNGEHFKITEEGKNRKFKYENNRLYIEEIVNDSDVLVVMPTYNRSNNIKNTIQLIDNQTYKKSTLLIIDDGSTSEHKVEFNLLKDKYRFNNKIIFLENDVNKHIAYTLNKGIEFFLNNEQYKYFTWISDDNHYEQTYINDLKTNNNYFKYSSFTFINLITNKTHIVNKKYDNMTDLLNNFKGCASFMWTKDAIKEIGFYQENINGCEDYEYLLRTFNKNKECSFIDKSLMKYNRHSSSLYVIDNKNIRALKNNIDAIFRHFNNNSSSFVYYSKTKYKLLFQRPHQIMRFYNKNDNKCFIGEIDGIEYEDKYKLLIVPYKLKDIVYNAIREDIITYYTDTRLYEEVNNLKGKKIYDLIDAPINDFAVWKPNLEKSVKSADYVIYSHPDLIKFLNEIDDTKKYNYISNACDYEFFSKAKNRIGRRPVDFPNTNKQILGYYGSFAKWIDYNFIKKCADNLKYHIVMIGGIKENSNYNYRFNHKNITWLDHKPYEELAYYLSWFDTCLLPFKKCELTNYVNPCKLWEYMASEKKIIKHNVNIENNNIIKYDDICTELYNINNNKNLNTNIVPNNSSLLIVLDKYFKGGLEKHTDILQYELNSDVMVFNNSVKNHKKVYNNYINYDIVIWQNIFNRILNKKSNQKYIYIVHSQCDWWSKKQKEIVRNNDSLIDIYIYVSNSVKENFEKNILVPKNSYVIENQLSEIKNNKKEIPRLYISSGSYNKLKGHYELICEFSKLDKSNRLEIYGDIHDKKYYDMLQKYISYHNLNNIKLFEYTDNYLERLKEAEYFCMFSKSEGCSYSMLEAINLNKRIICMKECLTDNMLKYKNIRHEFIIFEKQNYIYDNVFIKYYDFINNIDYFVDVKKSLIKNNYSKNDLNYSHYSIFFDNFYKEILNTNKNQMQTKREVNLQNILNNDIKLLNKKDKIPKLIFSIWITSTSKSYYPPKDKIIKLKKNIVSNPQYTFILVSNIYLDLDIKYNNFKYKKIDLENDYYYGRDILNRYLSENRYTAVSDILRFNLIYKYGGFYSDLGTKLILPSILNKFDYIIGQEGFCLGTTIFGSKPESNILFKICCFIDNLNRIAYNIRNISDNILTPPWTSIGILTCLSDSFLSNNELLLPITYNESIFETNHMSSWLKKDKNLRFGQPNFYKNPIKTTTYFIEDYNYIYEINTKKDIFSHFNILLFKNENYNLNWEQIFKIIKTNRQQITNISKNTYLNSKYILNNTLNIIFHKTWIGNKKLPDKNIYFLKKLDNYLSIFFKNSIIYFWITDKLVEQQIMDLKLKYIDIKIFDDSKIRGKRIYDIYTSDNRFANANDIARMNILYNYGGIYSDQLVSFEKDLSSIFNSYDYIFYKYEHNGNIDHGIFYTKEVNDKLIDIYLDNLDNIESNYGNLKDYFMNSEQELIFSGSHYLQFIIDTQFNDKKIFFLNKPLIQLERGSTWGDITSNIYKSIFKVDDKNKNKIFINYNFKILFDLVPIKILIYEKLSINLIFMANYLLLNYPDCFCYSDKNSQMQIHWKDINKYFNEKINYNKKEKVLNIINNLKSFDTTYTMKQIYDLHII